MHGVSGLTRKVRPARAPSSLAMCSRKTLAVPPRHLSAADAVAPSSSTTDWKASSAAWRLSTMSAAISSGGGRLSTPSRLSSLSQKMSQATDWHWPARIVRCHYVSLPMKFAQSAACDARAGSTHATLAPSRLMNGDRDGGPNGLSQAVAYPMPAYPCARCSHRRCTAIGGTGRVTRYSSLPNV